jgi:predicted lactoylglutathione lyase
MVKSVMGHIQIFIDAQYVDFYKELFAFLGWSTLYEDASSVSVADKNGVYIWFDPAIKDDKNDYDGIGMNHLALSVSSQEEVDKMVLWLQKKGRPTLFNTPCHRLDFANSAEETYYQVMFESPDRVLFEVVYTGPLNK